MIWIGLINQNILETVMFKRSFSVCLDTVRQKYFAAVNAPNAHCKHVSEPVKVHLFESHCLPILLYQISNILYATFRFS